MELYRRALDRAGYTHAEADQESVKECFGDYVAAGYWSNLDLDDLEGITVLEMCEALLKG